MKTRPHRLGAFEDSPHSWPQHSGCICQHISQVVRWAVNSRDRVEHDLPTWRDRDFSCLRRRRVMVPCKSRPPNQIHTIFWFSVQCYLFYIIELFRDAQIALSLHIQWNQWQASTVFRSQGNKNPKGVVCLLQMSFQLTLNNCLPKELVQSSVPTWKRKKSIPQRC